MSYRQATRESIPTTGMPKSALEAVLAAADNSIGSNLLRRALWLDTLGQQLHRQLPPIMADHCQLANVDGQCLVFLVDSPLWHAKLRLAGRQIIATAQKMGLHVNQVSIKTTKTALPFSPPSNRSRSTTGLASETTQEGLRQALACFTDKPSGQQHVGPYPNGTEQIKR